MESHHLRQTCSGALSTFKSPTATCGQFQKVLFALEASFVATPVNTIANSAATLSIQRRTEYLQPTGHPKNGKILYMAGQTASDGWGICWQGGTVMPPLTGAPKNGTSPYEGGLIHLRWMEQTAAKRSVTPTTNQPPEGWDHAVHGQASHFLHPHMQSIPHKRHSPWMHKSPRTHLLVQHAQAIVPSHQQSSPCLFQVTLQDKFSSSHFPSLVPHCEILSSRGCVFGV